MLWKLINNCWKSARSFMSPTFMGLAFMSIFFLVWPPLLLAETTVFMYAEPDALTLASHENARLHLESRQLSTLAVHTTNKTLANALATLPENLELLIITSKELSQALTQLPQKLDIPVIMTTDLKLKGYTSYTLKLAEAWYVLGVLAGNWPQGAIVIDSTSENVPDTSNNPSNALNYQAHFQAFQQGAKNTIPKLVLKDLNQLDQPDLAHKLVIVLESSPRVWEKLQQTGHQFIGFCPEPYAKNLTQQQVAAPSVNLKQLFASILMQNRFGMWYEQDVSLGLESQVIGIEVLKPLTPHIDKQVQAAHNKISKQGLVKTN